MKRLLKILKYILITLIALFGIGFILNVVSFVPAKIKNNPWKINEGLPLIIPHGGAKVLYPENTKYAFDQTAKYDVFEIDLSITSDGVLISHHDTDLKISTGIADKISELKYIEVKQKIEESDYYLARNFKDTSGNYPYKNTTDEQLLKEFIPVDLEYMFQTYPNHRYILEIKDTIANSGEEVYKKASDKLYNLIVEYEMIDKVLVASFDDAVIKDFRNKEKHIPTGMAWNESLKFVVQSAFGVDFFYKPVAEVMVLPNTDEKLKKGGTEEGLIKMLPGFIGNKIAKKYEDGYYHINLTHRTMVKDIHRQGMAVLYWTVNDKEEMLHLIKLGVDGIITDRPDLLEEVIAEYKIGQWKLSYFFLYIYTMQVRGGSVKQQLKKGVLEIFVLAILLKEDSYGYKIITDLKPYIEISESTLYPVLRRLEEQDKLETYNEVFEGRNRKYYKVTKKGKHQS